MPDEKKPRTIKKRSYLFILIVVSIGIYVHLLMDLHIKKILESTLSSVNKAQVDIATFETSFTSGYIKSSGIGFTNQKRPSQNWINISSINFKLDPRALLRGSIIIDTAAIEGIDLDVDRKSEGWISTQEEQTDDQSNEEQVDFSKIGKDLLSLISGDQQIADIKNIKWEELPSSIRIKKLEKDLAEKPKKWDETAKKISSADFKKYKHKIAALKINTRNLPELKNSIKSFQSMKGEINSQLKVVEKSYAELDKDIKQTYSDVQSLDSLVESDVNFLQNKLKIPSIDMDDVARKIMLKFFQKEYEQFMKYYHLVKPYIKERPSQPEPKDESQNLFSRRKGTNYSVTTKRYPDFWFKKGKISSKGETKNDLIGSLDNLSNNPKIIQKPAILKISGKLPDGKSGPLYIYAKHDAREKQSKQDFTFKWDQFPVRDIIISKSSDLNITIKEAQTDFSLNGTAKSNLNSIVAEIKFTRMNFSVMSHKKEVQTIMADVLNGVSTMSINAQATGPLENLTWKISSDLGSQLQHSLGKQLKSKVGQEKEKVRQAVSDRIQEKKKNILAKLDASKNIYKSKLNSKLNEAKSAESQANNKVHQVQNLMKSKENQLKSKLKKEQKKQENKAKDALKKKLKGFGF